MKNLIRGKGVPLPICDICNKEVDSMDMHYDHATMTNKYKVSCHGDVEYCDLADFDLVDSIVEPGRAFTTKRLSHVT